jgi:hypothetical protein
MPRQMPGLVPSIVQFPFISGTTWDVAASYFCAAMREYLEDVAVRAQAFFCARLGPLTSHTGRKDADARRRADT